MRAPDLVIEDLDGDQTFLGSFTEGFPDNVQTIEHMAVDGDPIGVFVGCGDDERTTPDGHADPARWPWRPRVLTDGRS